MIEGIRLDHVALALERASDGWPRYATELGGRWVTGGDAPGFTAVQLAYANRMRLELLEPARVEANDFLRRFLDRSGPGPHHVTFKVDELEGALEAVRSAGLEPVGVDTSRPGWKEAFLHPRQAHGVVVQLAQAAGGGSARPPAGFPPDPAGGAPAELVHVAHAVADLDRSLELFCGLLGGRTDGRGQGRWGRWVDLTWGGPGLVRLMAPAGDVGGLRTWLGGRSGRVHHLAFRCADPAGVTGAMPCEGGDGEAESWVVEPEGNLGTRLLLLGGAGAAGAGAVPATGGSAG
ncbi:MAG: VOC family protein [Acidimicrobiales bacterium]